MKFTGHQHLITQRLLDLHCYNVKFIKRHQPKQIAGIKDVHYPKYVVKLCVFFSILMVKGQGHLKVRVRACCAKKGPVSTRKKQFADMDKICQETKTL